MSFKVIHCDGTPISFYNSVSNDVPGNVCSLEKVKAQSSHSLVVAELVVISSYDTKRLILLLKEILPSFDYGHQFKAVIENSLLFKLEKDLTFPLQAGDLFAFFDPVIFGNPSFEQEEPKHLLQPGHGSTTSVYYSRKQTRSHITASKLSNDTAKNLLGNRIFDTEMDVDENYVGLIPSNNECDLKIEDYGPFFNADKLTFKIKAFLVKVDPNPSINKFDVVSGYCRTGCGEIFSYSEINWKHINKTALCPKCGGEDPKLGLRKELELMFVIKLRVLCVPGGRNITVLALRHQAEKFLQCSVSEYLTIKEIRERAINLLNSLFILGREASSVSPYMKLTVSIISNMACLVNVKTQVAHETPAWKCQKTNCLV